VYSLIVIGSCMRKYGSVESLVNFCICSCLRLIFLLIGNRYFEEGQASSVGITTGYGMNGPGIKSRWGRDFPYQSRPALGPTQPPVK
jgi:hypothetical protein